MHGEFHKACRLGDLESLENLINENSEFLKHIDADMGWSGLYRTVVCGHYKAANLLLTKSADPNILNKSGESPLHQAVESDQLDIAELLLQYKANPNLLRADGESPLHLSIFRSLKEMTGLLIRYGGNTNLPNPNNNLTPMDYAQDNPDIMEIINNTGISQKEDLHLTEPQSSPDDVNKSILEPEIEDSTKNSLYRWLLRLRLEEIFEVLFNSGYDDLSFLLEQMKIEPFTLEVLESIGITKIGHRMTLLAYLEEEVFRFVRKSIPVHSNCCSNKSVVQIGLKEWLAKINLQANYELFVNSGFNDLENIIFLMHSNYPLNDEVLKKIGITKIGHRQRILIQVKEEAKNAVKNLSFINTENEAKNTACGLCLIY